MDQLYRVSLSIRLAVLASRTTSGICEDWVPSPPFPRAPTSAQDSHTPSFPYSHFKVQPSVPRPTAKAVFLPAIPQHPFSQTCSVQMSLWGLRLRLFLLCLQPGVAAGRARLLHCRISTGPLEAHSHPPAVTKFRRDGNLSDLWLTLQLKDY